MHSSAQRLQRLRVITSNLLKSIHGFRVFTHLNGPRISVGILAIIITLVSVQVLLWRSVAVATTAHMLSSHTELQTRDGRTAELALPIYQSAITRVEIPVAGISAPVLDVRAMGESGAAANTWYTPHYAIGHHDRTGLPGQGTNIVFSAVSGDYGRLLLSLDRAIPGSSIIIYVEDVAHTYTVVSQQLLPGNSDIANAFVDASMIATNTNEQVTFITNWPTAGSNRYSQYLVVVAKPAP